MSTTPASTALLLASVELGDERAIARVLAACDGRDVRTAAGLLGLSWSCLYRLLRRRPELRGTVPLDNRGPLGSGPRKRCEARITVASSQASDSIVLNSHN